MHAPYRGHRIAPSTAAPLDAFAAPAAAYSMRKLKSTYAGPAIKLRRASDSATQDINFLGFTSFTGAPLDIAAANVFCAATSCFLDTIYDQSGNSRHVTQATPASQPAFVASCQNGMPCVRFPNGEMLSSASVSWASLVSSLSAVAKRASGTGQCFFMRKGNNSFGTDTTANKWYTTDFASASYTANAADAVWHAGASVINGASSVMRIDAAETGGSLVGSGGAAAAYFHGVSSTSCDWAEGVIWDGYALTPAERTALQANQKSFWGTP